MNDKKELLVGLAVLLMFAGIFARLTMPLFDNDFWWHLATGKWMWQNRAVMAHDVFDFVDYASDFPVYTGFFLKQYWLSQLMLYGVYAAAGFKGLILLRAAVLTAMFYALYRLCLRTQAGRIVSIALVYAASVVIIKEFSYVGLRPQMWTSLFTLVLILLLEMEREGKRWANYAIPALMLLWANMHGGFVLGVAIIAIYFVSALITRRHERAFFVTAVAGVALTALNPAGVSAYIVTWLVNVGSGASAPWANIAESQSLLSHASLRGIARDLPFVTGLAIASLASFVINIKGLRRYRIEYILLYALAAYMGAKAIRFIIFFAAIAAFITTVNLAPLVKYFWNLALEKKAVRAAALALTAALALSVAGDQALQGWRFTGLTLERPYEDDLAGAVSFVKSFGIKGNAFNEHGRGGYLIWWLWPEVRVFIDGRGLYIKAFEEYQTAMMSPFAPLPPEGRQAYGKILNDYGVSLAILSGCDKASGVLIPLSYALLNDEHWSVVYADGGSIVFMRDIPQYKSFIEKHALPARAGYDNILAMAQAAMGSTHGHGVPGAKLSLAVGYMGRGEKQNAHYWINEYLKQRPDDEGALMIKVRILRMENSQ